MNFIGAPRIATERAAFPICSGAPIFIGVRRDEQMTSYLDRLKDTRWQRKRLEILSERNWTCESCSSTEKTLHVHHRLYRKGAMPWEYESKELMVLCYECHEQITHVKAALDLAISELDPADIEQVLGFAQAKVATGYCFNDKEALGSLDMKRSWAIHSWCHARGFGLGLASFSPEDVGKILECQPISVYEVEGISMGYTQNLQPK